MLDQRCSVASASNSFPTMDGMKDPEMTLFTPGYEPLLDKVCSESAITSENRLAQDLSEAKGRARIKPSITDPEPRNCRVGVCSSLICLQEQELQLRASTDTRASRSHAKIHKWGELTGMFLW